MIDDENVYQELKKQMIDFGERFGLIVDMEFIKRSIKHIVICLNPTSSFIPSDVLSYFADYAIDRFIKEMNYIKYDSMKSRKEFDDIYFKVKELVDNHVCENHFMIIFKNGVYMNETIAVILKLSS
jgi:hypothetical protein